MQRDRLSEKTSKEEATVRTVKIYEITESDPKRLLRLEIGHKSNSMFATRLLNDNWLTRLIATHS